MKRCFLITLTLSTAIVPMAHLSAAEYIAGFKFDADAAYNDNIRLQQRDKTSVKKIDISPQLTLSAATEEDKAQFDSKFDLNCYDKSEFNSNDQDAALSLSHQFEMGSVGLDTHYVRNSTITSELLTSGRIGNKADRAEQYRVSPNATYQFGETNLMQLTGAYIAQNYESSSYVGYKDIEAEADWIHLLSERTKLNFGLTYSDYRADDFAFDIAVLGQVLGQQSYSTRTKSKGVVSGINYQLSEQSLIKFQFGRANNKTEYPVNDKDNVCRNTAYLFFSQLFGSTLGAICGDLPSSSGTQSTADLSWNWSNERQRIGMNVSKAIQPTSNGYAVDAIQLGSNWSFNLSELDVLSANLSLVRNRAIDKKNTLQNTSIADRNYGSASLQYQRQISEEWYVNAGVHYATQKYTDSDYKASSREYTLGIRYQPQQWHWSR